jgi:hypothetical protein
VKVGLAGVPVHIARDLSPKRQRAYCIADNQTPSIAESDFETLPIELEELQADGFDLGLLGFAPDDLQSILAPAESTSQTDRDDIPAPPDNAITQHQKLSRQHTLLLNQQSRPLEMWLADQIDQDAFAAKSTELRDRLASIKLQLESVDRTTPELAELALKVLEAKRRDRAANTDRKVAYSRRRDKTSNPRDRLFAVSISGAATKAQPFATKQESPSTSSPKGFLSSQVGMAGFEPTTSCTPSKRASQAALHPVQARREYNRSHVWARYETVYRVLHFLARNNRQIGEDGRHARDSPYRSPSPELQVETESGVRKWGTTVFFTQFRCPANAPRAEPSLGSSAHARTPAVLGTAGDGELSGAAGTAQRPQACRSGWRWW